MKYLVLGPSVMGAFAILGYLKHIESELENIKEISCSSSGCITAFFMLLGYSIDEILDIYLKAPITDMTKINIKNFMVSYGLVNTDNFSKYLRTFSKTEITFADLYESTDVKLHIAAYCVNTNKTVYFSVDTDPDMSVVHAMCMSISVPFLFGAVKYKGLHYLDGATTECIPYGPFINKDSSETLILKIEKNVHVSNFEIKSLKDYFVCLLKNLSDKISTVDKTLLKNTVVINLEDVNIFNFKMKHDELFRLFLRGQQLAILNHSGLTM